jgi:type II secretory pathway pseudopilin PulG
MSAKPTPARSFTLLEVLMAVGLLSLLGGIVATAMSNLRQATTLSQPSWTDNVAAREAVRAVATRTRETREPGGNVALEWTGGASATVQRTPGGIGGTWVVATAGAATAVAWTPPPRRTVR